MIYTKALSGGLWCTTAHQVHAVMHKALSQAWLEAHVEAFRFFGGAPKRLVPDNLSAGILRPDLFYPRTNRAYGPTHMPPALTAVSRLPGGVASRASPPAEGEQPPPSLNERPQLAQLLLARLRAFGLGAEGREGGGRAL